MIFYSLVFLIFFLIFCICLQLSNKVEVQWKIIAVANFVFYSYWDIRYYFLLLLVVFVIYLSARKFEKTRNNIWTALPILFCISVLGVYKYYNFFVESFCSAFGISNRYSLELILPLGISFYLFQAISYVIDVNRGKVVAERNIIKLLAYISFFPQVTSGPIVKAYNFLPQLEYVHKIKKENLYAGIQLFLRGLTKKVVFADRIGVAVNAVYAAPNAYNGFSILMAIIGYAIQIYCDFSGYSDMAIGIARILDFDLGKNFDYPYIALSPSDFWKRWHISLSSWFKEYVYFPLGGSRKGTYRTYFNLFVTMLLSGLWHGANWTFIVWGAFHGVLSIWEKWINTNFKTKEISMKIPKSIHIIINTLFVMLLWVPFRADSIGHCGEIVCGIFRSNGITFVNVFLVVYTVVILACHLKKLRTGNQDAFDIMNLDKFSCKVLLSIWIFLIVMFMYVGNSAFIYAQF